MKKMTDTNLEDVLRTLTDISMYTTSKLHTIYIPYKNSEKLTKAAILAALV